ncbi:MAG TPA: CotH kinase family protein, partial [Gammaproteobacteria bacterium]|nr:CotH kinase family protein [Gammaproteobacteria bacterium]
EAGALTDPIFESTMWWKKFNSVAGEENNFSDLAYLLDLIKNADDNAFKDAIVKIIDMDTFYTWQIHSMLAGSVHQDENHNMRIYFDKEKQRFFLIAWDVSVWDYVEKFERPRFGKVVYDLDVNYNPLVNRILNIPEFLLERNRRLWEYVKDDTNINEDIAYLDQATEKIKPAVFQDTQKYDRNGKADATMRRVRSNLLSNYAFLREQLGKSNFFATLSYQSTSTIATIDFSYVSASPINFNGLRISRVSSSPFNSFLLYEDSNRNGQFDWPDAKIANLKYENGMLSARKLDLLLYSDRIDNDYYEPITVRMTDKKFFVVAPLPFTIQNPNISLDIFNAITGTIINSLIHVNNREPFF